MNRSMHAEIYSPANVYKSFRFGHWIFKAIRFVSLEVNITGSLKRYEENECENTTSMTRKTATLKRAQNSTRSLHSTIR